MSENDIEQVAEIAELAHQKFVERNRQSVSSIGIISSKIRAMGIAADAVNIDCGRSDLRLVLIVLDQDPGKVGIGIGRKETNDYEMIKQLPIDDLEQSDVLEILENRFSLQRPD